MTQENVLEIFDKNRKRNSGYQVYSLIRFEIGELARLKI